MLIRPNPFPGIPPNRSPRRRAAIPIRRHRLHLIVALGFITTFSAAHVRAQDTVGTKAGPPPGAKAVMHFSFLGDAGYADQSNDAPIRALGKEARGIASPKFTAFLGDNVYDDGVPAPDDPDRARAESVLDRQLSVFTDDSTMKGCFIAGNHDWDGMGPDGRQAVVRQGEYLREKTGGRIRLLPDSARPGPVVVLRNDILQVIALDSQWWRHGYDKPHYPALPDRSSLLGVRSDSATREAIADSLYGLLHDFRGKVSIILAHHPLETHGPHGGHFVVQDHLFPLTDLESWLWLPLPFIGSLYPLARTNGYSSQDVSSDEYQRYIAAIGRAVNAASASNGATVFIASGHEHDLQVLRPRDGLWYLVSGNGILDHASPLSSGPNTVFGSEMAGYMTLDVYEDGGAMLKVIGTDGASADSAVLFTKWIPAGRN